MKKTLIINLYGGPGTGKSTGAAYIFSQLKLKGIDAEYVTEFAKDKVWEHNTKVFQNQMYVTGKQAFKISRCYGEVDVIITHSPIRLGYTYAIAQNRPKLGEAILEEADLYKDSSIDIFLKRVKPYNPNGRNQTEDEAKQIDIEMRKALEDQKVKLLEFDGDINGYNRIVEYISNILGV
jgi:adenylate kinase family enzyme